MSASPQLGINIEYSVDQFHLVLDETLAMHVTGFFGPSGCGKTTLLEILAGLRTTAKGRIALGDAVWQDTDSGVFLRPEQRRIGYVPQTGLLFPHKTVEQNINFGKRRAKQSGRDVDRIAKTTMELLELETLLHRLPNSLSGGERQRVAIGRALCSAPELLVLDEPLSALDHHLRYVILPFLSRVRDEFTIPMIWVSHDPAEVQALCDDLIVLRKGRRIARGRPREVLTNPDVFPMADERGFENILPCQVVASNPHETVVSLGGSDPELTLTATNFSGRTQNGQWITVPARSILIALEHPGSISARNILPAKVLRANSVGGLVLLNVEVDSDLPPLAVEVSHNAFDALKIEENKKLYVIIKSTACTLHETP